MQYAHPIHDREDHISDARKQLGLCGTLHKPLPAVNDAFFVQILSSSARQRPYSALSFGTAGAAVELPKDGARPALSCQHWYRRVLRWLLCAGKPVSCADNKTRSARLPVSPHAAVRPYIQSVVDFALLKHHSSAYHGKRPRRPVMNRRRPSARTKHHRTASAARLPATILQLGAISRYRLS